MAIADPRTYAKKEDEIPAPTVNLTMDQLKELIREARGVQDTDDYIQRVADANAQANKRALRPENEQHPGISVFSYPEGDQAHPKPDLKAKVFWVGYPLEKDTLTPEEVALVNELEPGTYTFTRTDNSVAQVVIEAKYDAAGQVARLEVTFPAKGDAHKLLPPMVVMLRAMLGKPSREEELTRKVRELESKLAVA